MMKPIKKEPQPMDRHVGARIRSRRIMLDMSQEKLGDALGLTFQQVQKYEKGTNRVGASRLAQIATILKCEVAWFFKGADETPLPPNASRADVRAAAAIDTAIQRTTASRQGVTLITCFDRMKPGERAAFTALAEAMVTRGAPA